MKISFDYGRSYTPANCRKSHKVTSVQSYNKHVTLKNKIEYDYVSFKSTPEKQNQVSILSGRGNPKLAENIASATGINLGDVKLKEFADGETYVKINENVKDKDVYIVQPSTAPVNNSIIETALMADAAKRKEAKSITAIIPYLGYERQDRISEDGEALSSKVHLDILHQAGVDKLVTLDIHSKQTEGFFDGKKFTNLTAIPMFANYIKSKNITDLIVVSPDIGGKKRAANLAKLLDCNYVIVDKDRTGHNTAEALNVFGNVEGKNCIVVDDMIDTAGSITKAADLLTKKGANSVYIMATHGLFNGEAMENIDKCSAKEVIVTNTLPPKENRSKKITYLDVSGLIKDIVNNAQISA